MTCFHDEEIILICNASLLQQRACNQHPGCVIATQKVANSNHC